MAKLVAVSCKGMALGAPAIAAMVCVVAMREAIDALITKKP